MFFQILTVDVIKYDICIMQKKLFNIDFFMLSPKKAVFRAYFKRRQKHY